MPYILNINVTGEIAQVGVSHNGKVLAFRNNPIQKEHASFLHVAINDILNEAGKKITDCNAIAVTSGPGSYTGIRVGLAAAKGFCYALKLPLIMISDLELIAYSAKSFLPDPSAKYCALIDARRMEVYAAVYDFDLNVISQPSAVILDESSFSEFTNSSKTIFAGSGSDKFEKVISDHPGVTFLKKLDTSLGLSELSYNRFVKNEFDDLVKAEPLYIKSPF